MKKNNILNIGVLGAANIATRSVIPSIVSLSDVFKLTGLASRDLSKAKSLTDSYGGKAYESYETLLAEPSIDAIYIPLPNSLHFPYVKMALEHEKHVLVEKSLGCSLKEVDEMVDIASKNNLVLLENFQFRFHSQLQTILQLVKSGEIGDLRSVQVAFGFPPFPDSNNIRYKQELGGGALLDAGAYAMKIAPYFLGDDIVMVHASMENDLSSGVDIWGTGVLKQKKGPLCCQFSYGFDNFYQCALELWGSKGKLSTNRIFTAPPNIEPKIIIETNNGVQELILPADNHYINMLKYFHSLIVDGGNKSAEYEGNILQANLVHQFKNIASKC
jgi:dTDP-3,4-didehydro-2,6-dideoxy-alpha-D-glucose 3-reductase